MTHPAERFEAPDHIAAGSSLAALFDRRAVTLLAESFTPVCERFDRPAFIADALGFPADAGVMDRAAYIADALARQLPQRLPSALAHLRQALGPPLQATEGYGLKPFFYLPHVQFIAQHGCRSFAAGMRANYAVTSRFTAEFSVRPFIIDRQDEALALLGSWLTDRNPHVRRLVSEGTRPRLPWAMRLPAIQADPQLSLPLLEALKDDPERYVTRSVANHLGDHLKEHPEQIYRLCHRWVTEVGRKSCPEERRRERHWMIRHAVRLPAKKKDPAALELRRLAAI